MARYMILDPILDEAGLKPTKSIWGELFNAIDREVDGNVWALKFHFEDEKIWDLARKLASVRTDGLVRIKDFDRSNNAIITEEQGESLQNYMDRHGAFRQSEVRSFLFKTLKTFAAFQRVGFVHGDVNPGMFFLPKKAWRKKGNITEWPVKLFISLGPEWEHVVLAPNLCPKYCAPEVCNNDFGRITPKSDLYSLGFIALEMLAGEKFESFFSSELQMNEPDWLAIHGGATTEELPPIKTIIPTILPDLEEALTAMLRRLPKERIGTSDEILAMLDFSAEDPENSFLIEEDNEEDEYQEGFITVTRRGGGVAELELSDENEEEEDEEDFDEENWDFLSNAVPGQAEGLVERKRTSSSKTGSKRSKGSKSSKTSKGSKNSKNSSGMFGKKTPSSKQSKVKAGARTPKPTSGKESIAPLFLLPLLAGVIVVGSALLVSRIKPTFSWTELPIVQDSAYGGVNKKILTYAQVYKIEKDGNTEIDKKTAANGDTRWLLPDVEATYEIQAQGFDTYRFATVKDKSGKIVAIDPAGAQKLDRIELNQRQINVDLKGANLDEPFHVFRNGKEYAVSETSVKKPLEWPEDAYCVGVYLDGFVPELPSYPSVGSPIALTVPVVSHSLETEEFEVAKEIYRLLTAIPQEWTEFSFENGALNYTRCANQFFCYLDKFRQNDAGKTDGIASKDSLPVEPNSLEDVRDSLLNFIDLAAQKIIRERPVFLDFRPQGLWEKTAQALLNVAEIERETRGDDPWIYADFWENVVRAQEELNIACLVSDVNALKPSKGSESELSPTYYALLRGASFTPKNSKEFDHAELAVTMIARYGFMISLLDARIKSDRNESLVKSVFLEVRKNLLQLEQEISILSNSDVRREQTSYRLLCVELRLSQLDSFAKSENTYQNTIDSFIRFKEGAASRNDNIRERFAELQAFELQLMRRQYSKNAVKNPVEEPENRETEIGKMYWEYLNFCLKCETTTANLESFQRDAELEANNSLIVDLVDSVRQFGETVRENAREPRSVSDPQILAASIQELDGEFLPSKEELVKMFVKRFDNLKFDVKDAVRRSLNARSDYAYALLTETEDNYAKLLTPPSNVETAVSRASVD